MDIPGPKAVKCELCLVVVQSVLLSLLEPSEQHPGNSGLSAHPKAVALVELMEHALENDS